MTSSKMFLEDFYDSKIFKLSLFIPLTIAGIMLLPFAIVASPFMFAWQMTKAITHKKNERAMLNFFRPDDKINDLVLDFNNWFNTGTGND